mmetsp:Transcript_48773/g.161599  ORF Transcript_48773/g.161599 Transcript_48773/m.161599 type:complete len:230 (+) Transcript_48773:226-915(+)
MTTWIVVDACAASIFAACSSSGSRVPSTTDVLTMRKREAEMAAASASLERECRRCEDSPGVHRVQSAERRERWGEVGVSWHLEGGERCVEGDDAHKPGDDEDKGEHRRSQQLVRHDAARALRRPRINLSGGEAADDSHCRLVPGVPARADEHRHEEDDRRVLEQQRLVLRQHQRRCALAHKQPEQPRGARAEGGGPAAAVVEQFAEPLGRLRTLFQLRHARPQQLVLLS